MTVTNGESTENRGRLPPHLPSLLKHSTSIRIYRGQEEGFLSRLFAGLIGGNFTLIISVITINQLIISREFSSPGELNEYTRRTIEYRQEVADHLDTSVSPIRPGSFFDFLVTLLREEAILPRDEVTALPEEAQSDIEAFMNGLISQGDTVDSILSDSADGAFETLLGVLNTNFPTDLQEGHRIQALHAHSFSPEVKEQLETVIDILEHIGVARQHMKVLYFQRTLTALSREILYTGVPALGLLVVTILVLSGDSGQPPVGLLWTDWLL